ncbi:MAG: lysophospholipid acyltransferase family protein [bacterium]|nr:lysophospholipid acyltransferase family protein [bacterium]
MKLRYFVEYVLFRLLIGFICFFSPSNSVKVGRFLGRLAFKVDRKHRRIAVDNLSMALGMAEEEAISFSSLVFENLGQTFAEFMQPHRYGRAYVLDNVHVEGLDNLIEAEKKGKGVLVLAAHIGNWELLGSALREHAGPVTVVYKKAKNPFVTEFIREARKGRGIDTIPHRNSARKILALLKKNETVGILLDQHATNKDAITADFFDIPAATNYGLALIALKTGAPVVPAFMVRDENGGYRCVYEKAIELDKGDDLQEDIKSATSRFNEILERLIRRYPEQWFWVHNRWKVKKYGRKKRRNRG